MLAALTSDEPLAARLARASAAPEGPERDVAVAVLAALLGQRDEAAAVLRRAPTESTGETLDLTAALVALRAGDAMRALVAAERVSRDPLGRALQAEALLLLGRLDDAERLLSKLDHPYALVVRAELAASRGAPTVVLARLDGFPPSGVLGARARRLRAEAYLALEPPDAKRARDELSAAVWLLVRIGCPDELGRCYVAMASVEQALGGSRDRAASWLARAHPMLSRAGTPFDQERLRRAFRRLGRRAIDRLVGADLEWLLESVRREHVQALDLVSAAGDARAHAQDASLVDAELSRVLAALGERQEELIGSLEGLLVDKERTGQLVAVCRAVFLLENAEQLDRELPRLATTLGGNAAALYAPTPSAVALVTATDGGERAFGPALRDALLGALRGDAVGSLELDRERFTLVPIRAEGSERVLAVRRPENRLGRGSDDAERLAVLGSVARAAYERARDALALREAAARDAATLEAIREGIVTLDEDGRVRSINGAAAALLGVVRREVEGRRLAELPGLAALAQTIASAADDETVALAHADVLVRSRHYAGGVVANVQELGRARQLAQKLVGSGARFTFEDLVGRHPAFLDAIEDARRVAVTDVPVLVTGESGSGKELLAQAIHNASPRASHPFVAINVAAIPRELLESELFGYEAGAFTGARTRGLAGKFELADRGTLLLDEIGDMPFDMQAKLLRVLQERVVVRLGGTREIPVRARVVATTHRDLEQAVRDGSFRLDLFYRLRVVHIRLPPLRERMNDVRLLLEHQLAQHARRAGRAPITLAPHVLEELERYEWPGNVRELANLLEGAASLLPPDQSVITQIPALFRRVRPPTSVDPALVPSAAPPTAPSTAPPRSPSAIEPLDVVERRAIEQAIAACHGNLAQAARALGVARGTLYNKLARYGLRVPERAS